MNIFIGSSAEAYEKGFLLDIARIIEDCKMSPTHWKQSPSVFNSSKSTFENLDEMISKEKIDASIFILSNDDKVWYRGKKVGKPRDNVIFEHGFFSGRLGREKSIIIKYGNVELPTDLSGISYIDFSEGKKYRGEIDLRQWLLNLNTLSNFENKEVNTDTIEQNEQFLQIKTFRNLEVAKPTIIKKAQKAKEIKILANKGLEFFGSDSSIISLAETKNISI